jgi:hypothetical protein
VSLIFALLSGAASAVVAILIHQTLPPYGVIAGLVFTYLVLWWIGRFFGSRKYKFFAALGWFLVMARAATFGAGQELLIQGDGAGTSILLLGLLVLFIGVARRI